MMMHCCNKHEFNLTDSHNTIPEHCPKCEEKLHFGDDRYCDECDRIHLEREREANFKIPLTPAKDSPKLYKLYKFEEMNPKWYSIMRNSYVEQHPIPTEMVILEPQSVTPKYGRSFETHLSLRDGKLYSYEELQKHDREFKGTGSENTVDMYEVWQDNGDDGHTSFKFSGFMFIDDETYDAKFRELTAYYKEMAHPVVMHWRLLDEMAWKAENPE
jgi:hypothetical protein